MKIALYRNLDFDFESIDEVTEWKESNDDRVRLTEVLEVEFINLPAADVLAPQVEAIDRQIKEEAVRHTVTTQKLNDAKQKLMAITHEVIE